MAGGCHLATNFLIHLSDQYSPFFKGVEPISEWKSPDSVQMSLVSYFFKLSMVLRNVHSTLTEEYEFPYWVSYVAFAVATILLGGILGLCLVCCIDCVFPPR